MQHKLYFPDFQLIPNAYFQLLFPFCRSCAFVWKDLIQLNTKSADLYRCVSHSCIHVVREVKLCSFQEMLCIFMRVGDPTMTMTMTIIMTNAD